MVTAAGRRRPWPPSDASVAPRLPCGPTPSPLAAPAVAFKSTEPWLLEYLALNMPAAMTAAGFAPPRQLENSPRHKTVVAVKPVA